MSDLLVRPATPADAKAIAEVKLRAWRAAYDGLLPASVLSDLSVADHTASWSNMIAAGDDILVAAVDAALVGFVMVGASRDDDAPQSMGELFAIYLDPTQWSRGVGHALHEKAIESLQKRNFMTASLWVLTGNDRAIAFYARHGWTADGATKEGEIDQFGFREERYVRLMGS